MRHTLAFTLLAPLLAALPARAAEAERQYPLGSAKLQLAGGAKASSRRINFSARWSGVVDAMANPKFADSTLRIVGGLGEGDTGLIRLSPSRWKPVGKDKGWVYADRKGTAGGIKSIQLRLKKDGGRVKIVGGNGLAYQVTKAQSVVTVTLIIADVRWCAEFTAPSTKKDRVIAKTSTAPAACPCDSFSSTFDAIQSAVFARNGCTSGGCHDQSQQGQLDLRPENAYAELVGVKGQLVDLNRVEKFDPQKSLLWRKLAAATEPDLVTLGQGEGSPMPPGTPISADELKAIRLWIQQGAPRDGVVPDTQSLLNSCLPTPEPPAEEPLAAPDSSQGVQFYAPPWEIPARKDQGENGENEVCYSTYYNLAGTVPSEFVVPCPEGIFDGPTNPSGLCFTYDRQLLRQSTNSHHSIIHIYNGVHPANHPAWGYSCNGGNANGLACDPTQPGVPAPAGGDCGGGYCSGKVVKTIACTFGYGPPDYEGGVQGNGSAVAPSFSGSQQARFERIYPEGVFSLLPIEGTIVWNSHAFNVYDRPIVNQQWLNIGYTGNLTYPVRGVFDSTDIFIQNVKPFEEKQYCRTVLFGKGTRIADFSSHTHKRGRLFRVWGPGITEACNSRQNAACEPEPGRPIMTTTEYNDPAQLIYEPPLPLDGDDPTSRRFKFCAIFDNGYTDPATVKRNSTSPANFLGGKCWNTPRRGGDVVYCLNKRDAAGALIPCNGDDRVCDSAPGANDGVCDACTLRGGVTTEDEMFILIGSYYCDTSVPGESCTGMCAGGPRRGESCHGNDAECPAREGSCVENTATPAAGDLVCTRGNPGQACTSDADCFHDCDRYSND